MEHYQLIIAYDGTEYRGFQRQKKFITIQGELESALRKIGWQGETIQAAGRTDTGVHASGQVVTFFHDWPHSLTELQAALNHHLPQSIAVQTVSTVRDDFHPRYDAVNREYKYAITISDTRQPGKERYMWRVNGTLNWHTIKQTASLFLGKHDFFQFGRPVKSDGSTMREVLLSEWEQLTPIDYLYTICADAFLYHMVRRLVYVMILVGEGRIDLQKVREALDGKVQNITPGIAPACGLTLTKVRYNDNK
jgi:tRNA pseudouridine38-40 synthase